MTRKLLEQLALFQQPRCKRCGGERLARVWHVGVDMRFPGSPSNHHTGTKRAGRRIDLPS